MTDYKSTLNLPETAFPMKGNLASRKPSMLAAWEEKQLYQKVREACAERPKFILYHGLSLRQRRGNRSHPLLF
jgi:isoleucyl-tRNA synthetase